MHPLFISFYTQGNGYEVEATELVASLDAHGLPHEVHAAPPFANWQRATQHKASFIRSMQVKHPDRPLVWLDADARVRRKPELFSLLNEFDFAAHWLAGEEMLAGTLYFGPTSAAATLVEHWIEKNRSNPNGRCGDQQNLQDLVDSADTLKMRRLPPEYAFIFDTSKDLYPSADPVILHMQASRRLKT